MRNRLIELLYQWGNKENDGIKAESISDYLLANGVIVPPCKVGDIVYQTIMVKDKTGFIIERKVVGFHLGDFPKARGEVQRKQYFIIYNQNTNSVTHIDFKALGKTVFLTKEEAEAKLKEGAE